MKCYDDPKREAVGVCTRCGKAVCPEDAVVINGKLYCKECAKKVMDEEKHPKKLYRSRTDRMIAGVCGGLAKYFNIDSTIVRIIFVLLIFIPRGWFWFAFLLYILLWLIIPEENLL